MKIKRQTSKLMSALLSFAIAFNIVLPTYALETIITEDSLEATSLNEDDDAPVVSDSRYEQIEVNYSQSSTFFVTIPKTITLGTDKRSPYSIKVEGDIVANKQVCVVPVDGITDTEVFDFYMKDQIEGSTKEDVVAEVSQSKFYWNHEEVAAGYEENNNYIMADNLSAGTWKGTFQMEISMRTDPSHIHNYVGEITKEPTCTETGEKTYTCDCGDSYTENIPAKGHNYVNGECTECGEKDPNHIHNYTETVTKEPTCTESGEKTYTCDCGDSYTETLPAKGHHYENGECTECGEKDPNHVHSYSETIIKEPTCTEAGEKTYACDCGYSYTETIPATGHNYVDGICTECGKSETKYTLKIDYPDFLNEVEGLSSNTQTIQDGDILELPEKTEDSYDLSGYSVARAVKNIMLCSSNISTMDAIYVTNRGPVTVEADKDRLEEFGLKIAEDINSWKAKSVPTDYEWSQTAVSDTIVIENPSVYVFTVTERQKCANIYDAGFALSSSITLKDITNNKSYDLTWLRSSVQKMYDYDNIKIRSIQKTVSSTSGTGTYDRKYKTTYMIYLEAGEYKITFAGRSGNGKSMGGSSIYSASIASPCRSAIDLPRPIINNVKHTAFGGTLYELIPIENGQEFDFSSMYTNENSTDIWLISNWTAKETQ